MYNRGRMGQAAQTSKYISFSGIIINISNEGSDGCAQRFQLEGADSTTTNFIVRSNTYFINHKKAALGLPMTAFYDANQPVPLIYPPQFSAIAANLYPDKNVKVDHFNQNLVSQDGLLRLNISPSVEVLLENGQTFRGDLRNRDLIVVYGATTRSIPAQTTPEQIIVIC